MHCFTKSATIFWLIVVTNLFVLSAGQTAYAATFTINSNADMPDATAGDGICEDVNGQCTLRAAMQEANALSGSDYVRFSPSLSNQTIVVTSTLTASTDITIDAVGVSNITVSGGNAGRVFSLTGGAITMRAFKIADGTITGDGAGINASATNLTMQNITFLRNTANNGGGGAIFANGGSLTIINGVFVTNNAAQSALLGDGGAIFLNNVSSFNIINANFSGNEALGRGGAIRTSGSTGNIFNITVDGNRAPGSGTSGGFGGGIYLQTGAVFIFNSTISNNSSRSTGAGLYAISGIHRVIGTTINSNSGITSATANGGGVTIGSGANATVINSTISGNTTSANGGGIFNQGTVVLRNSTIAFNKSVNAVAGAGIFQAGGTVTFGNTIVSNSLDNANNQIADVAGAVTSLGNNIVQNRGSSSGYLATDLPNGTNPLLAPLASNGGYNQTHQLLAGSPAINAGDNSVAVDSSNANTPLAIDERGYQRIGGGAVDIGAFESDANPVSAAVSGRVATVGGRGAPGAIITFVDLFGNTRYTITNSFGYFRLTNVAAGLGYVVYVSSKRFTIAPQAVAVTGNLSDLNLIAQ